MHCSIINRGIAAASKSKFRQRIGAVVFKGKRIVSVGFNDAERSIKSCNPKAIGWPNSLHAEVDAIIKARRKLNGYSIFVIRINNSGEWRLSKPCKPCLYYIQYAGIKNIYYTTNDGQIIRERI